MRKKISGWSNYPITFSNIFNYTDDVLCNIKNIPNHSLIARGAGRSYGDSSLGKNIISMNKLNQIIQFDNEKGTIECFSGININKINQITIPEGWILPVSPGTSFVTLGGAVASDIHGKNHHKHGCISNFIISMDIITGDKKKYKVSRSENYELFKSTCGGMGLTGIIISIKISLLKVSSNYINQKTIVTKNIYETLKKLEETLSYTYAVAWLDLSNLNYLGRGILFLGEHSSNRKNDYSKIIQKKIPLSLVSFFLNNTLIKLFNIIYFYFHIFSKKYKLVEMNKFFYPLDTIKDWNKIYGKEGFIQYQFVIPKINSIDLFKKIIEFMKKKKMVSYLSVLKLFGAENQNYLSFPKEGYTLTMDLPFKKRILNNLNELDKILIEYNGRIYLSKDSRMSKGIFRKMYLNIEKFNKVRKQYHSFNVFKSEQSKRLDI